MAAGVGAGVVTAIVVRTGVFVAIMASFWIGDASHLLASGALSLQLRMLTHPPTSESGGANFVCLRHHWAASVGGSLVQKNTPEGWTLG